MRARAVLQSTERSHTLKKNCEIPLCKNLINFILFSGKTIWKTDLDLREEKPTKIFAFKDTFWAWLSCRATLGKPANILFIFEPSQSNLFQRLLYLGDCPIQPKLSPANSNPAWLLFRFCDSLINLNCNQPLVGGSGSLELRTTTRSLPMVVCLSRKQQD